MRTTSLVIAHAWFPLLYLAVEMPLRLHGYLSAGGTIVYLAEYVPIGVGLLTLGYVSSQKQIMLQALTTSMVYDGFVFVLASKGAAGFEHGVDVDGWLRGVLLLGTCAIAVLMQEVGFGLARRTRKHDF